MVSTKLGRSFGRRIDPHLHQLSVVSIYSINCYFNVKGGAGIRCKDNLILRHPVLSFVVPIDGRDSSLSIGPAARLDGGNPMSTKANMANPTNQIPIVSFLTRRPVRQYLIDSQDELYADEEDSASGTDS